jgi:hypothetical protein
MHNPTLGPQPSPPFSFEPLGQSFADTDAYHPDSPSQLHQHQHQYPQSSHQELLNELRTTATTQAELITELKIRVAVLESELKRARKDKDDVVNSLGIVVGALTRASVNYAFEPDIPAPERKVIQQKNFSAGRDDFVGFGHSYDAEDYIQLAGGAKEEIKKLEEVEMLRIANKRLARKLREQEVGVASRGRPRECGDAIHFHEHLANARARLFVDDGHGHTVHDEEKSKGKNKDVETSARAFLPDPIHEEQDSSLDNVRNHKYGPQVNDSFVSSSTTIPNTPILPATQRLPSGVGDVGLESLDNILGEEEPTSAPQNLDVSRSQVHVGQGQHGTEEKIDIDEAIQEHQASLQEFRDLPAPGILKTGFEIQGSFRGEDYDKSRARRGMSGYNRFGSNSSSFNDANNQILPLSNPTNSASRLWTSPEERNDAIRSHQSGMDRASNKAFVEFFRHGIAYVPSETDSNYLRTVHIGNLPKDIELRKVLARIRGGQIISAVLLNTVSITGSMSAMVQFVHEADAEEYVTYTSEHPISFPPTCDSSTKTSGEGMGMKAEITLIQTPTYPLAIPARVRIHEHGQTRCLVLPGFPENYSIRSLERNLACGNGHRATSLIEFWLDEEQTLHLEFSSVGAAGSAYGILTNWQIYRGLQVAFERDPCAGALEELLEVKPRTPMLPRSLYIAPARDSASSFEDEGYATSTPERKGPGSAAHLLATQTKRLAALSNQKVQIPSFSGWGIKSSNWADEVNEEAEISSPFQNLSENDETVEKGKDGKDGVEEAVSAIMVNEMMGIEKEKWPKERKALVGLAGSKYATLIPGFEEHPRHSHPYYYTSHSFRSSPPRDEVSRRTKSGGEEKSKGLRDSFESSSEGSENEMGSPKSNMPLPGQPIAPLIEKPIARTPPRANLSALLASPETDVAASPSGEVSPISSVNGKKIAMHHIPGVSPPPTVVFNEGMEKVNPDEICLDAEDED